MLCPSVKPNEEQSESEGRNWRLRQRQGALAEPWCLVALTPHPAALGVDRDVILPACIPHNFLCGTLLKLHTWAWAGGLLFGENHVACPPFLSIFLVSIRAPKQIPHNILGIPYHIWAHLWPLVPAPCHAWGLLTVKVSFCCCGTGTLPMVLPYLDYCLPKLVTRFLTTVG